MESRNRSQSRTSSNTEIASLPTENFDLDVEFINAKLFLQKCSSVSGDNIYDHLCEIINKLLLERTQNAIDFFEDFSRKIKDYRHRSITCNYREQYTEPFSYQYANQIMPLLKEISIAKYSSKKISYNIKFINQCFNEIGFEIDISKLYDIYIHMRMLAQNESIKNLRFWGRVFGRYNSYNVIEAELTNEAYENQRINESYVNVSVTSEHLDDLFTVEEQEEEQEEESVSMEISLTKNNTFAEEISPEMSGDGLNKKVYYVNNGTLNNEWVQLPDVKPNQIVAARQILRYLKGNLEDKIVSYPEFPGLEKHFLRAQIARISSSTQISPKGFYKLSRKLYSNYDEDDDDEDDSEIDEEENDLLNETNYFEVIKRNKNYDKMSIEELSDSRLNQWVHHAPYIYANGITTFYNHEYFENFDDNISEFSETERLNPSKASINFLKNDEKGPSLFTAISNDFSTDTETPWTIRIKAEYLERDAFVHIRSHLWPGARTFANEECFENLYIGWGMKRYAKFKPQKKSEELCDVVDECDNGRDLEDGDKINDKCDSGRDLEDGNEINDKCDSGRDLEDGDEINEESPESQVTESSEQFSETVHEEIEIV